MDITVTFARTKQSQQISLQKDATIQRLLAQLGIKPDTCLTLINNQPAPLDSELHHNQHVTIIEVTSGG